METEALREATEPRGLGGWLILPIAVALAAALAAGVSCIAVLAGYSPVADIAGVYSPFGTSGSAILYGVTALLTGLSASLLMTRRRIAPIVAPYMLTSVWAFHAVAVGVKLLDVRHATSGVEALVYLGSLGLLGTGVLLLWSYMRNSPRAEAVYGRLAPPSPTMTLAGREMVSYFVSPLAYVVGAFFLLACGLVLVFGLPEFGPLAYPAILATGAEASLRPLFELIARLMVFVTPLLTMRLLSEEYRSGTIESLMTAPVNETHVIVGKFLGVLGFYLVLTASTLAYLVLIVVYGSPDPGVAIMGYLGLVLLGALFLAVGVFTSSLTQHQLLAALVGIAILGTFGFLAEYLAVWLDSPWSDVAAATSILTYFDQFARGVFDSRALVFFVSTTILFLFVSIKTLESRRWR